MIDALGTERHFLDHLSAVVAALPPEARGATYTFESLFDHAHRIGLRNVRSIDELRDGGPILVAAWGDIKRAAARKRHAIAYLEHGVGQSYGGDARTRFSPSYAGGHDSDNPLHRSIGLFLVPNDYCGDRWRAAYPKALVATVGSPRVAMLPRRAQEPPGPVVAFAWHWNARLAIGMPEAQSAWPEYRGALESLPWSMIGHGHPRLWLDQVLALEDGYRAMHIPVVKDFDEVCRRADLLVFDNTSAGFEFAATGRPVVVVNSSLYRRKVNHGGRFWSWADVGVQVDRPEDLGAAIALALEDPPAIAQRREEVLGQVFAYREGAAQRAADALLGWGG